MSENHYLKTANLVGEQLRYAVPYQGEWLALLGCSAAACHLKDRDQWMRHDRPKQLWVRSLVDDAPALLSGETLPEPWQVYDRTPPVPCELLTAQLPSLRERFAGIPDTRKGQGKPHRLATLLAIIACAKLSGISGGYRAIYTFATNLSKPQRRALRCWINLRTREYEVPSETTFFHPKNLSSTANKRQ